MNSPSSGIASPLKLDARGKLILRVALPRLAKQRVRIKQWLREYDARQPDRSRPAIADLFGIEALAYLAQFPPELRKDVLREGLEDEDLANLEEVVEELGDVNDPRSPAAVLQSIVPGTSEWSGEEPRLSEEPTISSRSKDADIVDSLAGLAATVETWPDDLQATKALRALAAIEIHHGSPLPLDFWIKASERLARRPKGANFEILFNLAAILARKGVPQKALGIWAGMLPLLDEIEKPGEKATALRQMAGVISQQGDTGRALDLWAQSLKLSEQIGDEQGKASTLHQMAVVIAQQGDIAHALELLNQSLELSDRVGDVQGKAATLHNIAEVVAQQGDIARALELWNQSLELSDRVGDMQGKAATLHDIAGVTAQQGDIERALELWNQSLELSERVGYVHGKASTLHEMAGVIAQQGDVERARDLWTQSLELKERIGHVQGKAATLANMAWVIAQQGDIAHALDLWKQSLELLEQIGHVKGKAATLHNIARVIAQQGDMTQAIELWTQSLELFERIGDMEGKAATLASMAWAAGQQGDHARARDLNIRATRTLASISAWLDCITVLGNLGTSEEPDAQAFLAQAVWLSLRVQAPIEDATALGAQLFSKVTPQSEAAPLIATWLMFLIQTRGEKHPKKEDLQRVASGLLTACMAAQGIPQEGFADSITEEKLNNPAYLIPALGKALEAMVPEDAWLFDRRVFQPNPPQS